MMQTIDFTEIGAEGALKFGAESVASAHYMGERLWPYGVDLLHTAGDGGASYVPDAADVFADTAGTIPAAYGGSIARVNARGGSVAALQSSTAARPLLGRAPVSRRNVLTYTDDLTATAGWAREGVTPVAVGNGEFRLVEQAAAPANTLYGNNLRSVAQLPNYIDGVFTVEVKSAERTQIGINYRIASAWGWIIVDLPTGAVVGTGNGGNASLTLLGADLLADGWRRLRVAIDNLTNIYSLGITLAPAKNNVQNYTGDGVSGVLVRKPQLEPGAVATSYQRVTGTVDMTEDGVPSYPFVRLDLADDALTTTLPASVTGDLVIAGRNGSWIESRSGATVSLGPVSTPATPGILRAAGDIVGWSAVGKTLTADERTRLLRYFKRRGAKGLLMPGAEKITNGAFAADVAGWSSYGGGGLSWSAGAMRIDGVAGSASGGATQNSALATTTYPAFVVEFTVVTMSAGVTPAFDVINGGATLALGAYVGAGTYRAVGRLSPAGNNLAVLRFYVRRNYGAAAAGDYMIIDNVSLRELRPEEDW